MGLLLYSDYGLTSPLPQLERQGRRFYRFELPRNSPGGTSRGQFTVYNDSSNPVEELSIVHNDGNVKFYHRDTLEPKGRAEVTVEWTAPLGLREALTLFFMVRGEEVARPSL